MVDRFDEKKTEPKNIIGARLRGQRMEDEV